MASSHAPETSRRDRVSEAVEATRRTIRHRRWLAEASGRLPDAVRLAGLGTMAATASERSIGPGGTVTFVVPDGTGPGAIVKMSRLDAGIASLQRAAEAQRRLRAEEALGPWRALVPEVFGDGPLEPWWFVVERRLVGRSPDVGAKPYGGAVPGLVAALGAIAELHRATAAPIDPTVARAVWVDARIDRLGPLVGSGHPLDSLRDELAAAVAGIGSGSWIHGDLWSDNILVDESSRVTGFVDWDSAASGELPDHDVLHLVLYARKQRERRPLGRVLAGVLTAGWGEGDRALLDTTTPSALATRPGLLLYWLRFVEVNLQRQPGLASSSVWLGHNVAAVLACR